MTKQGEIDYFKDIGLEGIRHSLSKPFSDAYCGRYLMELGAIMLLLPPPPAKLLDLGCGTGWTSSFLSRRGYDVTGQDISEIAIDHANKNRQTENLDNLKFIVGDYEDMYFDNEFDCVVFFDSLHHSNNEVDALKTSYKALKFGGVCITSEPGIRHAESKMATEAVKRYDITERNMTPRRIIKAGKKAGFKAFEIYPHASSSAIVYGGETDKQFTRHLLKFKPLRTVAAIFGISFYKRFSGIVLLTK
jgi:SAM-dependent methyltransferase